MQCDEGCGECCGVILVTETEFQRISRFVKEHGITPVNSPDELTCPMFIDGKCSVYPVRPMICKAYGHADTPALTCPRGYNVNVPREQVDRIMRGNGEPTRVLHEIIPGFNEKAQAWTAGQNLKAM
jgi:Fe-S-cluster containining protein